MVIKRLLVLLLALILITSCGNNQTKIEEMEKLAIGDYSVAYPKSWDKRVNSQYSYGFSFESDDFFYASKFVGLDENFDFFVESLPSFSNEYTYTSIYYDLIKKGDGYFTGNVFDKEGVATLFWGYYNDHIFLIYIGENSRTNLEKSIESLDEI